MKLLILLPVLASLKAAAGAPVPDGIDDSRLVDDVRADRFDQRQRTKEYWARMLGYPFTWQEDGRLDVIREGYALVHHPELAMKYKDFVKHMKEAKKVAKVEEERRRKKAEKDWAITLAHEYYKFVDEDSGLRWRRALPPSVLVERQLDGRSEGGAVENVKKEEGEEEEEEEEEKRSGGKEEKLGVDQYAQLPESGARQLTQKEASGRPLYPWNWPAGAGSSNS